MIPAMVLELSPMMLDLSRRVLPSRRSVSQKLRLDIQIPALAPTSLFHLRERYLRPHTGNVRTPHHLQHTLFATGTKTKDQIGERRLGPIYMRVGAIETEVK